MSLVIAIVLSSLVIYIVETFDPSPEYNDFCDERVQKGFRNVEPEPVKENQVSCEEVGGTWMKNNYCDYDYECRMEFDDADDKHNLIVFLVSVPVGLVAIGIGIALALPSVSSGLMLGGVFLTFFGTVKNWSNFSNLIRVVILAVALVALIWLGYKKLGH